MLKKILKNSLAKKNSHPLHLVFNLNKVAKDDLLTDQNIEKISRKFPHLLYLDIKGDNVFANPKMLNIVASFARHQGFSVLTVFTASVDEKLLLEKVKEILAVEGDFLLKIVFSMDNIGEKLDQQKGASGEFAALTANIAALAALKQPKSLLKVEVMTMISKHNITSLIDIMDYVRTKIKDVDFHNLSFMPDSFNKSAADESIPHVNSLEARKTLILRTWKHYLQKSTSSAFVKKLTMGFLSLFIDKVLLIIKNKKMVLDCYAGVVYAMINTEGNVFFCNFDEPVGNLSDYDFLFSRLWYSHQAIEKRNNRKCSCYDEFIIRDSLLFNRKFYFEIFKRKSMWKEI